METQKNVSWAWPWSVGGNGAFTSLRSSVCSIPFCRWPLCCIFSPFCCLAELQGISSPPPHLLPGCKQCFVYSFSSWSEQSCLLFCLCSRWGDCFCTISQTDWPVLTILYFLSITDTPQMSPAGGRTHRILNLRFSLSFTNCNRLHFQNWNEVKHICLCERSKFWI